MRRFIEKYTHTNLMLRIVIGLVIGTVLGFLVPGLGAIMILGDLFVGALKAMAPILVFVLVVSSLVEGKKDSTAALARSLPCI